MNHFISGIIKIIILEAQAGLVLFDRLLGDRFARQVKWAFIALALAMTFAWTNYGALRGNFTLTHHWEQFHFYLGAKYQKEVGWFDLYKAAVLADAETTHVLTVTQIRDNSTFELVPVQTAFDDRDRIVNKQFGPERWEQFKQDWRLLLNQPNDWNRILQDHGNSNSPAWSLIAHPIAELVPFTPSGQSFIGWLDMILMAIMWWQIWKYYGWKIASVGLLMWSTPPNVFDYLAGSFLRWDWLFCLGMTLVFMKREKWLTAGAFLGFAIASKLFPLWFAVAFGLRAAITCWRDKKLHDRYRRFFAGTAAAGLLAVLLSSAMFGGFWVWGDYKKRIDAAVHERFYAIQYSLRTVYLQVEESSLTELGNNLFFPAEMKQARPDVDIGDHLFGFTLVELLFTAMVLLLVLRTDDIGAFCLGPLLVFTWLTVNMYYWNMLAFLAIGLIRREGQKPALGAMMGLNAIFMAFFLYQHTNHGMSEGYVVALLLSFWMIGFSYFEYRALKAEMTDLVGMLYGRKRA